MYDIYQYIQSSSLIGYYAMEILSKRYLLALLCSASYCRKRLAMLSASNQQFSWLTAVGLPSTKSADVFCSS